MGGKHFYYSFTIFQAVSKNAKCKNKQQKKALQLNNVSLLSSLLTECAYFKNQVSIINATIILT